MHHFGKSHFRHYSRTLQIRTHINTATAAAALRPFCLRMSCLVSLRFYLASWVSPQRQGKVTGTVCRSPRPRAGGWARADGAAQSPPPSGGHAAPHSQTHVCSSLQPYFLSSHRSPLALTARDPPTGRARRHGLLPSWLGYRPRYCFLSINSLRPPPSGLPPPQKSYRSTSDPTLPS